MLEEATECPMVIDSFFHGRGGMNVLLSLSSSNRKPCVKNSRTGVADLPRRERVEQSERNNANESGKDLSCLHHCPRMVTRQYERFSPVVIYSRENNSVHQPNFHPVSHSL